MPTLEEIIKRNLARWNLDQAHRREKREKLEALAALKGMSLKELREQRAARYRLANCRATLHEIVEAHQERKDS